MNSGLKSYIVLLLWVLVLMQLLGCTHKTFPSFDYKKAKQLSQEKRRAYDMTFFNDIVIWNMNTIYIGAGLELPIYINFETKFKRMSDDGYLPAYVALRLLDIRHGRKQDDTEALAMLLKSAEAGNASAMCAFVAIPFKRSLLPEGKWKEISQEMTRRGTALRQPACMARMGAQYLLGYMPNVPKNIKVAMPLLLDSAQQGYYVPANILFHLRFNRALAHQFDFSNKKELKRALCWGRLAEQQTNWTGFDFFLSLLRNYAGANERPDLVEMSYSYDPKHIPITKAIVKPEDCIKLEHAR